MMADFTYRWVFDYQLKMSGIDKNTKNIFDRKRREPSMLHNHKLIMIAREKHCNCIKVILEIIEVAVGCFKIKTHLRSNSS